MSAQPDLLEPRCRIPENRHGQLYDLLFALKSGKRLTVKTAIEQHGCYALSQRMGELKRDYGWPIQSRMIEVRPGTRVSEYWLA